MDTDGMNKQKEDDISNKVLVLNQTAMRKLQEGRWYLLNKSNLQLQYDFTLLKWIIRLISRSASDAKRSRINPIIFIENCIDKHAFRSYSQ